VKLRCFVLVELKTTEFKPEYVGKLDFYLSAADDLLSHPQDNATLGILLCKTRSRVIVEYALRDVHKLTSVTEYELAKALPEHLKSSLLTAEQSEMDLKAMEAGDFGVVAQLADVADAPKLRTQPGAPRDWGRT